MKCIPESFQASVIYVAGRVIECIGKAPGKSLLLFLLKCSAYFGGGRGKKLQRHNFFIFLSVVKLF